MYHQDPIPSEKARFEYLHSFYSKINRGISRPSLLVHKLLNFLYGCNLLSDKLFLSLKFRLKMGGESIGNPPTHSTNRWQKHLVVESHSSESIFIRSEWIFSSEN